VVVTALAGRHVLDAHVDPDDREQIRLIQRANIREVCIYNQL
jgi:hypothetical protein